MFDIVAEDLDLHDPWMQWMELCDSGEGITHDRDNHIEGTDWGEESG